MDTNKSKTLSASDDGKSAFLPRLLTQNISYFLLAAIFAAVLSSGYYFTSSYRFSQRLIENKNAMLDLITAFVSTYSQQQSLNNDLPVPAAFRIRSLKYFDENNDLHNGMSVKLFSLSQSPSSAQPPDRQVAKIIARITKDSNPEPWSGYVGGFGEEVLRTIKPVQAAKSATPGEIIAAYVIDMPTARFFTSLRREAGVLWLGSFLFIGASVSFFMHQMARIAAAKAQNLQANEKEAMLSAAKKQAENQAAKLSTQVRKAYEDLRQALTKERELNVLQRQFISMASHEFRTPLAIIDGAAQRLERRAAKFDNSAEITRRALKIRNAVARMTRVMESTLNAASLDIGKLSINVEPCDMAAQLSGACQRQMELTGSHQISCDVSGLPATIQADPGSLEQIFSNLLSNAVKYAPNSPDIDVKAYAEGDEVVLSVRDTGLGIDEEDLPRVFERFFRARTATGIAGSGIGLNLIKILIELHDGSITIESKVNQGSTLSVRLPISGPEEIESKDCEAA